MPGSNFDDVLPIGGTGEIVPAGPLKLEYDETLISVHAWVTQLRNDGTGAFCAGAQEGEGPDSASKKWTCSKPVGHGRFESGKALGMAVQVSRYKADPTPRVYWWSETVTLK